MTKRRRRNRRKKLIYIRFIFIIILLFITVRFIQNGFARYRSTATSQADVDLAYYFVKAGDISQDLKLERILPRTNKYTYSFSVAKVRILFQTKETFPKNRADNEKGLDFLKPRPQNNVKF